MSSGGGRCHPEPSGEGSSASRSRVGALAAPVGRKIGPVRIRCVNQCELLRAKPAFDLLLPSYRSADVRGRFNIHQTPHHVPTREIGCHSTTMVEHSSLYVVGDTDVQRSRSIREDVDEIRSWHAASCCVGDLFTQSFRRVDQQSISPEESKILRYAQDDNVSLRET